MWARAHHRQAPADALAPTAKPCKRSTPKSPGISGVPGNGPGYASRGITRSTSTASPDPEVTVGASLVAAVRPEEDHLGLRRYGIRQQTARAINDLGCGHHGSR